MLTGGSLLADKPAPFIVNSERPVSRILVHEALLVNVFTFTAVHSEESYEVGWEPLVCCSGLLTLLHEPVVEVLIIVTVFNISRRRSDHIVIFLTFC